MRNSGLSCEAPFVRETRTAPGRPPPVRSASYVPHMPHVGLSLKTPRGGFFLYIHIHTLHPVRIILSFTNSRGLFVCLAYSGGLSCTCWCAGLNA